MAPVAAPAVQVPTVDHKQAADNSARELREVKEKLLAHSKELQAKTRELVSAREKALSHNELVVKMQEEIRARKESEEQLRQRLEKVVDRASRMMKKRNKN